jgi:hypothetical protein
MQKTRSELHTEANRAFMLVADHYATPAGLSLPPAHIHTLFHFVEANRWIYYLRHIAYFKVPDESATRVEGVTHSYASDPKIGINKSYHSFATLVHESVHFFSHYQFRKAFSVNHYEGATEYLARQLLQISGPRRDAQGQGDIYAEEVALFVSVFNQGLDIQTLCKAYFVGEKKAITQIKNQLNESIGSSLES